MWKCASGKSVITSEFGLNDSFGSNSHMQSSNYTVHGSFWMIGPICSKWYQLLHWLYEQWSLCHNNLLIEFRMWPQQSHVNIYKLWSLCHNDLLIKLCLWWPQQSHVNIYKMWSLCHNNLLIELPMWPQQSHVHVFKLWSLLSQYPLDRIALVTSTESCEYI